MKNFKNIGLSGVFFLLFFYAGNLVGQNLTQDEPSQSVREIAKERTDMWLNELALTEKQVNLMERKIIEYTMKRTDLMRSKMNEEAKIERFIALQILEEKDMRDILTATQHEKYLRINRERAVEENKNSQGKN